MNGKKLLWILISAAIATVAVVFFLKPKTDNESKLAEPKVSHSGVFTDGLKNPSSTKTYALNEFDEGIAISEVFSIDINGDGARDRITRDRHENGTAHFFYQYKIELNNAGAFIDITPDDFRTIEGADCALQKLQFVFQPQFMVIKISRPWEDTWITATRAEKTVYNIQGNSLVPDAPQKLQSICDVAELF